MTAKIDNLYLFHDIGEDQEQIVTKILEGDPAFQDLEPSNDAGDQLSRIVTLIESPEQTAAPLASQLSSCVYCTTDSPIRSCDFDRESLCGYYRMWKFAYPTCCIRVQDLQNSLKAYQAGSVYDEILNTPVVEITNGKQTMQQTTSVHSASTIPASVILTTSDISRETNTKVIKPSSILDTVTATVAVNSQQTSLDPSVLPSNGESGHSGSILEPSESLSGSVAHTRTSEILDRSESVSASTQPLRSRSDPSRSSQDIQAQSPSTATSASSSIADQSQTDAHTDKIKPSPTVTVVENGVTTTTTTHTVQKKRQPDPEPSTAIESDSAQKQESDTVVDPGTVTPEAPTDKPTEQTDPEETRTETPPSEQNPEENGSDEQVIYASEKPSGQELDLDMISGTIDDDIQYQKLSVNNKKETTFMRLKNKIAELELNLNLSSQ